MRIRDGNIYITRGEVAAYEGLFFDKDGVPLKIFNNPNKHCYLYFAVKKSLYDRISDDVFETKLFQANLVNLFDVDNPAIEDEAITGGIKPETSAASAGKQTIYITNVDGGTYYWRATASGSDWTRYSFQLAFNFDSKDTKDMSPGKYYYEIGYIYSDYELISDYSEPINENERHLSDLDEFDKFILVEPKTFEVGGSIVG